MTIKPTTSGHRLRRSLLALALAAGGLVSLGGSAAAAETFGAGGRSYVIETTSVPMNASPGRLFAICPSGEQALSGGFSNSAGFNDMWLDSSFPAQSSGSSGYHKWGIDYRPVSNPGLVTLRAFAICDPTPPRVVVKDFTLPLSGSRSSKAKCPGDRHVVGGGGLASLSGGFITSSYPVDLGDKGKAPDDAWKVTMANTTAGEVTAEVSALCAKFNPAYRTERTESIDSGVQGSARASCPTTGKRFLVGGGQRFTPSSADVRVNASSPFVDVVGEAPSRSWIVYLDSLINGPADLTAYAICAKKG